MSINLRADESRELPAPLPAMPSLRTIIEQVCIKHGISLLEFMSDRRSKRIAHARQEYYWRARNECYASFPQIGIAARRDHTTVMSGARAHAKRVAAAMAEAVNKEGPGNG